MEIPHYVLEVYQRREELRTLRESVLRLVSDYNRCVCVHVHTLKWNSFVSHFSNQWPLKGLHNVASHSPIRANIHPPTAETTMQCVRVRCLTQGLLEPQLGGAGDRTSNLPVTSQVALPPEPHVTQCMRPSHNTQTHSHTQRWCSPGFIVFLISFSLLFSSYQFSWTLSQ